MSRRFEHNLLVIAYAAFAMTVLLWSFDCISGLMYAGAALLTLAYPVYQYVGPDSRRVTALRRRRDGCCRTCGFDLRETQERCPECGRVLRLDRTGG